MSYVPERGAKVRAALGPLITYRQKNNDTGVPAMAHLHVTVYNHYNPY